MARQWFIPIAFNNQGHDGGMIDEDGEEEYFVPTVGVINEDQAAAVAGDGLMAGIALLRRRRR